jgi:hypothetical protein
MLASNPLKIVTGYKLYSVSREHQEIFRALKVVALCGNLTCTIIGQYKTS